MKQNISQWYVRFIIVFALAYSTSIVKAENYSFSGRFTEDDDLTTISFNIPTKALVTFRTTSYMMGGFDPMLTLFDVDGAFILEEDDAFDLNLIPPDPITGERYDVFVTTYLTPNNYILAVTQFDNFALGNLQDGFSREGEGNFTGELFGPGNGKFYDVDGNKRSPFWAVSFEVTAVPEPGSMILLGIGLISVISKLRPKS